MYGLGAGIGFQQGAVVPQTVLSLADTAVGSAWALFMHIFGGAVFVAAAQNVFARHLVQGLISLDIPALDAQLVFTAGATGLRDLVSEADLPQVLIQYNEAVVKTFQLGLILSCISIVGALGIEWKSVKNKQ